MINASFCRNITHFTPHRPPHPASIESRICTCVCVYWLQHDCARLEKDCHPLVELWKPALFKQSWSLLSRVFTSSPRGRRRASHRRSSKRRRFPKIHLFLLIYLGRWMMNTILVARAEVAPGSSTFILSDLFPNKTHGSVRWRHADKSKYLRGLKKIKTGVRLTPRDCYCECWCILWFGVAFRWSGPLIGLWGRELRRSFHEL